MIVLFVEPTIQLDSEMISYVKIWLISVSSSLFLNSLLICDLSNQVTFVH
jgi:hypothetical protein